MSGQEVKVGTSCTLGQNYVEIIEGFRVLAGISLLDYREPRQTGNGNKP